MADRNDEVGETMAEENSVDLSHLLRRGVTTLNTRGAARHPQQVGQIGSAVSP